MTQATGVTTPNWRTEPATPAQVTYINGLADSRVLDTDLRSRVVAASAAGLTKQDAAELIPLLQARPTPRPCRGADSRSAYENYVSPVDWGDENPGYASPDQPTGYEL